MGSVFLPLIKCWQESLSLCIKISENVFQILCHPSALSCSLQRPQHRGCFTLRRSIGSQSIFANYTSSLLAVNTTLPAYAGIIVAAGVVVGLVLYFIAPNPQQRYYGNSNAYNSNYYSQSRMLHDASNFLGDFDLL